MILICEFQPLKFSFNQLFFFLFFFSCFKRSKLVNRLYVCILFSIFIIARKRKYFLMFWKDSLPKKKLHWNMILLVLPGKMVFLFTKKIILFFIRKNETCLSRKNTWKYDIFCKFSEKMVFLIQWQWNMVFLVLSGKIIFIFLKNMI